MNLRLARNFKAISEQLLIKVRNVSSEISSGSMVVLVYEVLK